MSKRGVPDYGKKGEGNIGLKERYGKQNTALLRCKTCKKTFSDEEAKKRLTRWLK